MVHCMDFLKFASVFNFEFHANFTLIYHKTNTGRVMARTKESKAKAHPPSGNRKYSSRGDNSLDKFISSNGQIYGTLTLDTRRELSDGLYPLAIRVAFNGKNLYLRIGDRYTLDDWTALCECEKQARNKKAAERKKLKGRMDKVLAMVEELLERNCFSLNQLRNLFQGKQEEEAPTNIYKIWEDYIDTKRQLGQVGSARTGKDIYKRFVKYMGNNVSFEDIDHNFLLKWISLMKKDGLGSTSCAISLRTFRTIVNICISEGLIMGNTKDMFKDTDYNKSGSRKHEFLDVDTMRALYDFWDKDEAIDENGKQLFFPKRKYAIFRDLGLFLFMYLGDGQNLADTLRLTYDEWYFATHGKQIRFYRNKTRDRNESASEVIFPVTEEMQKILNKYANEPKPGRRVFPIMKEFITPEQELQVIQRYNKYIRNHMAIVSGLMGMEQRPSSTWARHSFATNLNNSGKVPYKYISDSMGHSSSGDITSNYIGAYPLKKMLEFNWYLLHDASERANPHADKQELISILKNMSEEERKELLASI